MFFHKIRSQDASWSHLGAVWVPKGVQDDTLLGTKLGWERVLKSEVKKVLSWEVRGGGLQNAGWRLVAGVEQGEDLVSARVTRRAGANIASNIKVISDLCIIIPSRI